jgi:hypothetical protein
MNKPAYLSARLLKDWTLHAPSVRCSLKTPK